MNRAACSAKTVFKKVTHVIFDLDGLLLDTEKIYKDVFSNIANKYGKVYTTEVQAKIIGTPEDVGAKIAVSEMKLPLSPQQFLHEYKTMAEQSLITVGFMPGAERLVKHLHSKKIPIAVATSSGQDTYDLKVARHKCLFSLFHHVVCGGTDPEVKHGKPNPDIFLICASRFEAKPKPEECLVLEDAPNGVKAAVSAGMQVIMVPDKQLDEKFTKPATLKLNSLTEVKPEQFGLPPIE